MEYSDAPSMFPPSQPLEALLESWRENPVDPQDFEALHRQAEDYVICLEEILPSLPFPVPTCLAVELHDLEQEQEILVQMTTHIAHDIKVLEHHYDTVPIWLELAMLQERQQLLETAIRVSRRLNNLQQEMSLLSKEIRDTLKRALESTWDSDFAHRLEARREHILDAYEALKQQLELYADLYHLGTLVQQFRTLTAMLDNLDETLDAMSAGIPDSERR